MKVTIYANYGMLAHEKEIIFSEYCPASDIYEEWTVEVPDEIIAGYAEFDNAMLVKLENRNYRFREVLSNYNDRPCIIVPSQHRWTERIMLDVIAK